MAKSKSESLIGYHRRVRPIRSKNTNFNRLLIFLSVADIFLIVFFLLMSSSTVLSDPPQWFVVLFPYVLW